MAANWGFLSVFSDRDLDGMIMIVMTMMAMMMMVIKTAMLIMSECLVIWSITRDISQQLTVTSSPCSVTVRETRMPPGCRNNSDVSPNRVLGHFAIFGQKPL